MRSAPPRTRSRGAGTAAWALAALLWPAATQAQDATGAARIAAAARALGQDDPAARLAAYEELGSLPETDLEAIRERLVALRRGRPEPDEAQQLLHTIRRATGSRRADDIVDVADGIPLALASRRDGPILRIAEPLLLLRSLERIGTTAALELVPEVLRLDRRAWDMEGCRLTLRLGDRGAAAMILARAHEDRAGRQWARWSSEELQLDDPGRLVARLAPGDLADVLRAWGRTRTMDALPVVASYVDDARRNVRAAAREGLRAYGQNSLWQAREQYRLRLGEAASEAWGWERTLDALEQALDQRRLVAVRDLENRARQALDRGDLAAAREALDAALMGAPDASGDDLASRWVQLGDRSPSSALHAYRRARRLAPAGELRRGVDARLALLEAEQLLAGGVLDEEAYRAGADEPACPACVERAAALGAPQDAPTSPRLALLAAAALFAAIGLALLRSRPAAAPGPDPALASAAPTPSDPPLAGLDAETTLS